MLTIRQILAKTPSTIKVNAADVIIRTAKISRKKLKNPVFTCKAYSKYDAKGKYKGTNYQIYDVVVEGLMGPGTSVVSKYVKVSCSCDYFWSHCEVALNAKDAADIKYSNGDKPVVTNPSMIPYVCKHLVAALEKIQQRQL